MSETEFLFFAGILSMLGKRWTLAILQDLNALQARRFTELKRSLGISGTMLSERLAELEREGLVERKIYGSMPPKVEYRLTASARELLLTIKSLGVWRAKWNSARQGQQLASTVPLI